MTHSAQRSLQCSPECSLQCYPQFDWRDEFAPVVGGGANADGSATLKTGAGISGDIKPLARFIGMNMLSELDAPHEYYIDAGQQRLDPKTRPPMRCALAQLL